MGWICKLGSRKTHIAFDRTVGMRHLDESAVVAIHLGFECAPLRLVRQSKMLSIRVSVQGRPRDRTSWIALARSVEDAEFDALYVADHPGNGAAPFVALALAAAVTERIRVGTCVANAGMWDPVALASEVATLDVVSGGRAIMGIGAGHTPAEWTSAGRPYPSPGRRVDRMIELVSATQALLVGEVVTSQGPEVTLHEAELIEPRPLQVPMPLLIGGNGDRVLRFGAATADRIGITGLGRTLADGHHHEVDWSDRGLDRIVGLIAQAAEKASRSPVVDALVQHVQITDDAERSAVALTEHISGASVGDLLGTPFVWIGTIDEIVSRLRTLRNDYCISHYTIRDPAVSDARRILDAMAIG